MSWFGKDSGDWRMGDDDGEDLLPQRRGKHAVGPVGRRDVRALERGGYVGKHRGPAPKGGKGK